MSRHLKKISLMVLGAFSLVLFQPSSAKAQHIVTEVEAGKLTLASLTAAPLIRSKKHYNRSRLYASRNSRVGIRTVSYRTVSGKQSKKLIRNAVYRSGKTNKITVKSAVYRYNSGKKFSRRHKRS